MPRHTIQSRAVRSRAVLSLLAGLLIVGAIAGAIHALDVFSSEKNAERARKDLHRMHRDLGESVALLHASGFEVTARDVRDWLRDLGTGEYLAGGSTAMRILRADTAAGEFLVIAQVESRDTRIWSRGTGQACGRLSLTPRPDEPVTVTDTRCPDGSEGTSIRFVPPCPAEGCATDRHLLGETILRVQRARSGTPAGSQMTLAPLPSPTRPVGELRSDSTELRCARGTRDIGVHAGYADGRVASVRLCAIAELPSTGAESSPGSAYYVPRARGEAIVNVRVSGAVRALVRAARRDGIQLSATSSFRTMRHQRDLCTGDDGCRAGEYTLVARPGWSQHQLGVAVDFSGTSVTGSRSCRRPAKDPESRVWQFLRRHASAYGFRQYAAESWHWDALPGPGRCDRG